jgi:outer membrane lipoprotein-sorting protein
MIKMKAYILNTSALLILLIAVTHPGMAQDDPKAIFTRAVDQLMTSQMGLSMDIVITDEKGRVKEKAYDILMAQFGEVEKTRMVMQKPERAKGITMVITNVPDQTGVIEVYTPANGKTRKMKATPENMARAGSNFILSSYTSYDSDELSFTLAEMQEVDGKRCYTLHLMNSQSSGGKKAEFLVEESTYHIVRILFFDDDGNNTTTTTLSDYQAIEGLKGKIQPMLIETDDKKEHTRTRMQIVQVASRPDLKEEDFTIQETSN